MALTLSDLSERMRKIDFCMLTTGTQDGGFASRPMSNNGQVDYEGDSYFFTYEDTRKVADIGRDDAVGLTFTGESGSAGEPPLFISVSGTAELIRDKDEFEAHWVDGLDRWFPDGVDTEGLLLIKVEADQIHYWDGEDDGEVTV